MKNYLRGLLFLLASLPLAGRAVAQKWVAGNHLNIGEGTVDRVMVGDLDSDGAGDVVTLQSSQLTFYQGDGKGGLTQKATPLRGSVRDAVLMAIKGGDEAVVMSDSASGTPTLTAITVSADGVSETSLLPPGETPALDSSCKLAIGHFTQKDHTEVMVGCPKQSQLWVLDPAGQTAALVIPFEFPAKVKEFSAGDLRSTGLSDLVISGEDANGASVEEVGVNSGAHSFSTRPIQAATGNVYATDYNGDTASDLLMVSSQAIIARAAHGASLTFDQDQALAAPSRDCSIKAAGAGLLLDLSTHNGLRGQDIVAVLKCPGQGSVDTQTLQIFRNVSATWLEYSVSLDSSGPVHTLHANVTVASADPSILPQGNVEVAIDGTPLAPVALDNGTAAIPVELNRDTHTFAVVYRSDNGLATAAGGALLKGHSPRKAASLRQPRRFVPGHLQDAVYHRMAHLMLTQYSGPAPSTPYTNLGAANSTSNLTPVTHPTTVQQGSAAAFSVQGQIYIAVCTPANSSGINCNGNNTIYENTPFEAQDGIASDYHLSANGAAMWFIDGVYSGGGTEVETNNPFSCGTTDYHADTLICPSGYDTINFSTPTNLSVGSHTVLLQWAQSTTSGEAEADYQYSFPLTVTASPTTTISVSASANPINYGGTVTFVASISSGPTGAISFLDGGTVIGTGAISGTTASFTTSSLSAGSHSITASWAGNGSYNAATSSPITETVNKITPTITWGNPGAITYGTALSGAQLNASASVGGSFAYSPGSGTVLNAGTQTLSTTFTPSDTTDYNTATASVSLTVNKATPTITWGTPGAITYGTALGGAQLNASASVGGSFAYSPGSGAVLNAGTQTLSTTFTPSDTTDYNGATASVGLTVNQATPTITWGNPAAISYGTALSGAQLNASASVGGSFAYSPGVGAVLGVGTQTLSTTFTPTSANYRSAAASVSLQVNKGTPTISVRCSPNPVTFGNSSTTCTESQSGGTGTVSFVANGNGVFNNYTYATTSVNGNATGFSGQPAGSYTVTVNYSGDSNNNPASASTTFTINKATPTISLSSSASSINYGGNVTFTASLSSGPSGEVNFLSGGTVIGSGTISGTTASFTTSGLGAGSYSITASYVGNANYAPVDSGAVGLTVNKFTPTISVSCAPDPVAYGNNPVTCTETQSGGTGTVTYFANGGQFNNFNYGTSGPNGSVTAWNNVVAGSYTVTVQYGGDGNYTAASASTPMTIAKASPSVAASLAPTTVQYGQLPMGTATVSCGYNCGGVQWVLDGVDWGVGSGISNNGTFSTAIPMSIAGWSQSVGSHSFSVNFIGDANDNNTSSNTVNYTVTQASTVTSLTTSVNPTQYGSSTVLTAIVSTKGQPSTGTVGFMSNGASIGSGTVSTATTTNLFPYSDASRELNLSGSSNTISSNAANGPDGYLDAAVFSYPANTDSYLWVQNVAATVGQSYTVSVWARVPSGTLTVPLSIQTGNGATVLAQTEMALTSTWQRFSVTAVQTSNGVGAAIGGYCSFCSVPAGTIQLYGLQLEQATKPGPLVLTSGASATGSGGIATLATNTLPVGTDSLVATYSGDTNDTPSTSNTVAEVVTQANSVTILSAGANSVAYGAAVALTAQVNTAGGAPTGNVTFTSNGTTIGSVAVSTVTTTNLFAYSDPASEMTPVADGSTISDNAASAPTGVQSAGVFAYPGHSDSCVYANYIPGIVSGSAYTFSVWLRVPSGSVSTVLSIHNGANTVLFGQQTIVLTSTWQRFAVTGVSSDGTLSAVIAGYGTLQNAAAGTIQMWGAQLEQAGSVGPLVSTSGVPATGSGGVVSINPDNLPLGTDAIVATYSGDGNTNASTSNTVDVNVLQAGGLISLTTSENPITAGQPLTLTALVSTVGAAPTGSVAFTSNGTNIGSGTISSVTTTNILAYSQVYREMNLCGNCNNSIAPNGATGPDGYANDADVYSYGAYADAYLWANYVPGGQAGKPYTMSVWLRSPSGNLSTFLTMQSANGQTTIVQVPIVITSTWTRFAVTAVSPDGGIGFVIGGYCTFCGVPAGTIQTWGLQVEQGETPGPYIETNGISSTGSGGVATLTTSTLPVGTDSLVASYAGDAHTKAGTSNTVAEVVDSKPVPTMSVNCSPNPMSYGGTTTCTVTQSAGTGTIAWTIDDQAWTTSNVGQSVTGLSTEAAGSYTVTANYSGDSTYNPQSASTTVVIQKVTPSIAVSCTPSSVAFGAPYTCTASIGDGANGNVVWSANGSPFSGTYTLASGQSVLSVPADSFNAGSYTITAAYAGDINNNPVSASAPLTVGKSTPTITWATPAPISYGTALSGAQLNATASTAGTFTYTPATGTVLNAGTQTLSVSFVPTNTTDYTTATATVTLTVNKAAPSVVVSCAPGTVAYSSPYTCTASLGTGATGSVSWTGPGGVSGTTTVSNGTTAFSTTASANGGEYTITASYAGDANNLPETGTATLIITPAALTLSWPTPSPITYGTPLSATQLNASSGGVPGTFIYTPAPGTILSVGTQTLHVLFIPANSDQYSSATATTTITVTKAPVNISISSSLNPSPFGMIVTFTINFTGPAGTAAPTGTAAISDGAASLGTLILDPLGHSVYVDPALNAGAHTITVKYNGDSNYY